MLQSDQHAKRESGFTLVELLVVIAIIAVLLGLLLPALSGTRNSARLASTRALMTTVDTAVKAFRAEKSRLPGVFDASELADVANGTSQPSITPMENALLELMGGVVPISDPVPAGQVQIELGSSLKKIQINPSLVGAKDGPGYLSIGKALRGVQGQVGQASGLPDVIDPFGQPIIMWVRDEYAGPTAEFASIDSTTPAQFSWTPNASYVTSQGLGEGLVDQRGRSLLSDSIPNAERIRTITAVCGHPAFPNNDLADFGPAQVRGDVILHSAGIDQFFLGRPLDKQGELSNSVTYIPYLGGKSPTEVGLDTSSNDWAELDRFDDLIVGGG